MSYILAGANIRGGFQAFKEEERWLTGLEGFLASTEKKPSHRGEALEWYAGYLTELGFSSGTILGRIKFLRDQMSENFPDISSWFRQARNRMKENHLMRALKRRRGEEAVQNVKPLYHISVLEKVLVTRPPEREGRRKEVDGSRLLRWRSFFFILIATGCRPKHVLGIRALILTPTKLFVRWGARKIMVVPPTDYLVYKLSWSCQPPEDVATFLQTFGVPTISNEINVASSCNAWLATLGTGLTRREKMNGKSGLSSCCPRVNLSTTLGKEVIAGRLTKEEFNILLDHNIESSMIYYRRLSDAEDMDEEAESEMIDKEEEEEDRNE